MSKIRRIWPGVAAAAIILLLAGCSPSLQGFATDKGCRPGPIVFVIPDVSGSTERQRAVGGDYERDMMKALRTAAEDCADVYSAPADANTIADGRWVIDGKSFRQTIGGNDRFGAAARQNAVKKLLPKVRYELKLGKPDGTDLLGAAQRVGLAIESLEHRGKRPIKVVWLTDGAINLADGFSVYDAQLRTPELRRKFVQELAAHQELPDFGGKVDFYMGGVGLGVSDRDRARDIIATWKLIVPAMHANLKSIDSTLRFE